MNLSNWFYFADIMLRRRRHGSYKNGNHFDANRSSSKPFCGCCFGRLKRHRLIVVEKLAADTEKIRMGFGPANLMQKRRADALTDIIHELLHPFALSALWCVKARLRIPERSDITQDFTARGQCLGFTP